MPSLSVAVLSVALALPRPYCPPRVACDRTGQLEHLRRTAVAVASAAERAALAGPWASAAPDLATRLWPGDAPELAAALLTVAWCESRLSARVQAGLCPLYGCGGPRPGLAHSQWQIESSPLVPAAQWLAIVGDAPVQLEDAAWTAARVLARQRAHCAPHARAWAYPTLAGYATGNACAWGPARRRARMLWRVDDAVRRALRSP